MALLRPPRAPGSHAINRFAVAVGLSERECAVLASGIEGCSMKETAARLDLSVKTVETYWKRIYVKTGMRTQLEVIAMVLRWVLGG